jgi:GNAT superfamily N-acetyltransferase
MSAAAAIAARTHRDVFMSGQFGLRCGTDLLKACARPEWKRVLVEEEKIRPIELYELGAAADLRERMTRELSATGSPPENPGWRVAFERFYATRIAAGTAATFVIRDTDRLVAMASVYRLVNHRSEIFAQPSAYISNVYVVPELRRRGFASRLTQACVAWARDQGCVVARLRTSHVGRPVYASLGFSPSDELELPLGSSPQSNSNH